MTGMPSGRCFPVAPLFGIYTRLTGRACHGSAGYCTRSTSSAFAVEDSTTSPSTPAVLRPALISVTRRTLADQRVCAVAEHQLLQTADPLEFPGLRRREDPLPETPYVVLNLAPID